MTIEKNNMKGRLFCMAALCGAGRFSSAVRISASSVEHAEHADSRAVEEIPHGIVDIPIFAEFDSNKATRGQAFSFLQEKVSTKSKAQTGAKTKEISAEDQASINKFLEQYTQLAYGVIHVGTPSKPYKVLFDTGSSELVLPLEESCKRGACLSHTRYDPVHSLTAHLMRRKSKVTKRESKVTVMRKFGARGVTRADVYKEKVCIDKAKTLCLDTPLMAATDLPDEPFSALPYDGILGVGLPEPGQSADFGPGVEANIFAQMVDKKILKNNRFSIWMKKMGDLDDSKITFGGFDKKKLASRIYWVPAFPESAPAWTVHIDDIVLNAVGSTDQALNTGICPKGKGCRAVIDTSSPFMVASKKILSELKSALAVDDAELFDCGPYNLPSGAGGGLMPIGFRINGIVFNLEKQDYVEHDGGQCLYKFQPLEEGHDQVIYLGLPFLQKFYAVFDRDALKVGLAVSNHVGKSDNPEQQIVDEEENVEKAAAGPPPPPGLEGASSNPTLAPGEEPQVAPSEATVEEQA